MELNNDEKKKIYDSYQVFKQMDLYKYMSKWIDTELKVNTQKLIKSDDPEIRAKCQFIEKIKKELKGLESSIFKE